MRPVDIVVGEDTDKETAEFSSILFNGDAERMRAKLMEQQDEHRRQQEKMSMQVVWRREQIAFKSDRAKQHRELAVLLEGHLGEYEIECMHLRSNLEAHESEFENFQRKAEAIECKNTALSAELAQRSTECRLLRRGMYNETLVPKNSLAATFTAASAKLAQNGTSEGGFRQRNAAEAKMLGAMQGRDVDDSCDDLESGFCGGSSIRDMGLGDVECLRLFDVALQHLSALMVGRAEARLGIFGIWLLCHLLYVASLLYYHIF